MENNEIALPDTQSTYNNLKPILENQGYKLEKMENTFKQGGTIVHNQGSAGGVLVGKRHSEGGIKAINKSNGEPLEMEGGEVVITRNAVSDTETMHEFDGKKMTKKEILSEINVQGGGIAFANGGEVPTHINVTGKRFNYGGKLTPDYEIVKDCGCQHNNTSDRKKIALPSSENNIGFKKFADGGTINNESFFLGVQTEKKEHQTTLRKLREGKITEEEALREIAATHLKNNPEYYQHEKYEKGGRINNDTQRTQLINEARLHCNEVNGIYKNIFEQETEQCLYECAVQCNSSAAEASGAKKVFGESICTIAVQLYPNAKVERKFAFGGTVKKYPSLENINNVDVIQDASTLTLFNVNPIDKPEKKQSTAHYKEGTEKTVREIEIEMKKTDIPTVIIKSSNDSYNFLNTLWDKKAISVQEEFIILVLDRKNQIIGYNKLSKGGVDATVVDTKILVGIASKALANSVIVAHNHPSGNLKPSQADITISNSIKNALAFIRVELLDSMIIAPHNGGFYSLRDNGDISGFKLGGTIKNASKTTVQQIENLNIQLNKKYLG